MKLCILCEDANVIEARQRLLSTLPTPPSGLNIEKLLSFKEKIGIEHSPETSHLKVPCSPTGELPATHWFCFINVNEETHQKMLGNQLYTIIEEDKVPTEFLASHGLQRIKTDSPFASKN